jgi:hypothetical protein
MLIFALRYSNSQISPAGAVNVGALIQVVQDTAVKKLTTPPRLALFVSRRLPGISENHQVKAQ